MRSVTRDPIPFPTVAPELMALTAADRDHWITLQRNRARARTLRHGFLAARHWLVQHLGFGKQHSGAAVVSVASHARQNDTEGRRRVA